MISSAIILLLSLFLIGESGSISRFHVAKRHLCGLIAERDATISRQSRTSRLCVLFFLGSPTSAHVVHSVGRAEVSVAFMTCASSVRPDYRTRLQRYDEQIVFCKFFRKKMQKKCKEKCTTKFTFSHFHASLYLQFFL